MASGLINVIKRAAIEANEAANYTDLRYGVVTNTNPLEVTITPEFVLPEQMLVIPGHLTDYTINMAPYGSIGEDSAMSYVVFNALQVDDRVALIREHGGRKYFILDRY